MSSKPWLVLDCYLDAAGGAENFVPFLRQASVGGGHPVQVLRPPQALLPLSLSGVRGVVITGSAAGVNDGLAWVGRLVEWVRRLLEQRVPLLGVCFGHQVLAEALAGPGAVRRAPLPEVGWFDIERQTPSAGPDSDPLLQGFPPRFRTFLSHFDEVRPEILPRVYSLARSARCPVQALRVPQRPAWGVQFHAEMGAAEACGLVRKRIGTTLPGDPEAALAQAVDSRPLIRQLLANFCAATGPQPLPLRLGGGGEGYQRA